MKSSIRIRVEDFFAFGGNYFRRTAMARNENTRRRFMGHFAAMGFGATLLPEILWARMQESQSQKITLEMVKGALEMTGLPFTEMEATNLVNSANNNLATFDKLR